MDPKEKAWCESDKTYEKLMKWCDSGDRTADVFWQLCLDMGEDPDWNLNGKLHETFNDFPIGELIKIEAMFDGKCGIGNISGQKVAEILFKVCGEQNTIANNDDPINLSTLDEEHLKFLCTLMKNKNGARRGGYLFASYCEEIPEEENVMRIIWKNAKSKRKREE